MLPRLPFTTATHDTFRHPSGAWITVTRGGNGPPLVLVHGLAGSRYWWAKNIHDLEDEFTVYRVELAGFGAARRQRPLDLPLAAGVVADWMRHEALVGARVMGHSMGGHVALHLAGAAPDRVERLVLVAPTGLLNGNLWQLVWKLPQAALAGHPSFIRVVAVDALRAGLPNLYHAGRFLLRDDVQGLLAHVTQPTLVVSGGRDALVPPALGVELSIRLPNARHVLLASAGHVVMWDSAEDFNRAALDFLRREAPRPPAVEATGVPREA